MNNKEWLIVGGLLLIAFFIGRKSSGIFGGNVTNEQPENVETDQTPTIANGQAYFNMHLSLSGTAYNGLSNEYFPLFGFVGARAIK